MNRQEFTIRWRNKPLDKLSSDEMRTALAEALGHAVRSQQEANPLGAFYSTFLGGMLAGGISCFGALAILHAVTG